MKLLKNILRNKNKNFVEISWPLLFSILNLSDVRIWCQGDTSWDQENSPQAGHPRAGPDSEENKKCFRQIIKIFLYNILDEL